MIYELHTPQDDRTPEICHRDHGQRHHIASVLQEQLRRHADVLALEGDDEHCRCVIAEVRDHD